MRHQTEIFQTGLANELRFLKGRQSILLLAGFSGSVDLIEILIGMDIQTSLGVEPVDGVCDCLLNAHVLVGQSDHMKFVILAEEHAEFVFLLDVAQEALAVHDN